MKTKLTDDQAEMLAYFVEKGTFETDDLFNFFSKYALWNKSYKYDVFGELANADLIKAKHESFEVIDEKNIQATYKKMYVTDVGKALLLNFQKEKAENERKEQLERALLSSTIETNQSVIKTNNLQKFLIGSATLFSAVTLVITYLDYQKEKPIIVQPAQVVIQQSQQSPKQDSLPQSTLQNSPRGQN